MTNLNEEINNSQSNLSKSDIKYNVNLKELHSNIEENPVPQDILEEHIKKMKEYTLRLLIIQVIIFLTKIYKI